MRIHFLSLLMLLAMASVSQSADEGNPVFRSWAEAGVGSTCVLEVRVNGPTKGLPYRIHMQLNKLEKNSGTLELWTGSEKGNSTEKIRPMQQRIFLRPTIGFGKEKPMEVRDSRREDPEIKVTDSKETITIHSMKIECDKTVYAYKGGKTEIEWTTLKVPSYVVRKRVVNKDGGFEESWDVVEFTRKKK